MLAQVGAAARPSKPTAYSTSTQRRRLPNSATAVPTPRRCPRVCSARIRRWTRTPASARSRQARVQFTLGFSAVADLSDSRCNGTNSYNSSTGNGTTAWLWLVQRRISLRFVQPLLPAERGELRLHYFSDRRSNAPTPKALLSLRLAHGTQRASRRRQSAECRRQRPIRRQRRQPRCLEGDVHTQRRR